MQSVTIFSGRKNYNWETSKAHNASHLAPQESSSSLEVKVTPPSPFTGKLTPDQKKQGIEEAFLKFAT